MRKIDAEYIAGGTVYLSCIGLLESKVRYSFQTSISLRLVKVKDVHKKGENSVTHSFLVLLVFLV